VIAVYVGTSAEVVRLVSSLEAEAVGSGASGRMTLKVVVALQSARESSLGQQPASVHRFPAGQYSGYWSQLHLIEHSASPNKIEVY
jgi:hypothetical protein